MSYDSDGAPAAQLQRDTTAPPAGADLEAIVLLLDVAGLYLTPEPGAVFSFDELIREANEIGDGETVITDEDARIVLASYGAFRKCRGGYRLN